MSCFPRSVYATERPDRYPERRHDPHGTSNDVVTVDRRVTHAGFVERTSFV